MVHTFMVALGYSEYWDSEKNFPKHQGFIYSISPFLSLRETSFKKHIYALTPWYSSFNNEQYRS